MLFNSYLIKRLAFIIIVLLVLVSIFVSYKKNNINIKEIIVTLTNNSQCEKTSKKLSKNSKKTKLGRSCH
jgi:hypothetical protein